MSSRLQNSIRQALTLSVCLSIGLAGCGGDEAEDPEPGSTGTESSAPATPGDSQVSSSSRADENRRPDEIYTDADGRQWLGKVPYDVFYDDPLAVIRDQSTVPVSVGVTEPEATEPISIASSDPDAGMSTTPDSATSSESTPGEPEMVASASGSGDWNTFVSAVVLDNEVTTIRNFLNEKLQSVGTYNSSMLMIPQQAATLAVLAKIAEEHPGDVSWKPDAKYIASLAGEMNSDALQRGAKTQRRLLELFENISDILSRSPPAGLEEPDPEATISDIAEMRFVMRRMKQANDMMKTEVSNETSLAEKGGMVKHEASILATMAQVLTTSGYGYSDDEEFTGFAGNVRDAAFQIRDATEATDFATFEAAMTTISQNCDKCHREYNQ